jgi:transporter family-2 protein
VWQGCRVQHLEFIVLGIAVGALIPLQTAVNTRLSVWLGAVLPASLVSFAIGTAALAVAALVTGTPIPWATTATTQPWWIWIGGVCGLVFLTMNIVLMPRIGASATVILPLVGQVLGGVAIDMTGAFGTDVRPLTAVRALGALLVVAGAAAVNLLGRTKPDQLVEDHVRPHPLLWVVAVLTGTLGAIQTAVNGRLGQAMGSGLASALVSFLVGTLGLALICLVTRQRVQRSGAPRPWLFVGGLLGATFVLVNAVNAPLLGTGLAVSVVLFGQVAMGLTLDHAGWLGIRRRPVTALRIAGAALVLLGVVLVRFG